MRGCDYSFFHIRVLGLGSWLQGFIAGLTAFGVLGLGVWTFEFGVLGVGEWECWIFGRWVLGSEDAGCSKDPKAGIKGSWAPKEPFIQGPFLGIHPLGFRV